MRLIIKIFALILILSCSAYSSGKDTTVTKKAIGTFLETKRNEAKQLFNTSLTAEQIKLKDAITSYQAQLDLLELFSDTLRVKK